MVFKGSVQNCYKSLGYQEKLLRMQKDTKVDCNHGTKNDIKNGFQISQQMKSAGTLIYKSKVGSGCATAHF